MVDPYNAVRINGSMPGGEVWSINPKFMGDFGPEVTTYEGLQEWAEGIASLNAGGVFPSSWREILSTAAAIVSVRTEYYDATGVLAQAAEYVLTSPASGSFAPDKPFQTAMVVSLRTGRPGRSYRGRLYLPALNVDLNGSTLRVDTVLTTSVATEGAEWLRAVADAAPAATPLNPAVVSQTLGTSARVTSVQVGNVLDTQRRRRDSLAEAYVSAPVGP